MQSAGGAQHTVTQALPKPPVWPVVTKLPSAVRSFAGHTDTVPNVVGRIGTPSGLVIFTEGNHLMVLLSDEIVGARPSWAKSQPRYADLNLDNIVVVTSPQPAVVQMIRAGGIVLGNLTLNVSRRSGFYPRHSYGRPRTLATVARTQSDPAGGAFLLLESRSCAAGPQRQPARDTQSRRRGAHRLADRPAGCGQ